MEENEPRENIAQTLAEKLPVPVAIVLPDAPDFVGHVGVPAGWSVERIDDEDMLDHPRRTKAIANLSDPASFIEFVQRYKTDSTIVWCGFNPQTFDLSFRVVVDDHRQGLPGWRSHQAIYTPGMSTEWKVWMSLNGKPQEQVAFAEFLEAHEPDISTYENLPSSLDLMKMATEFQSVGEIKIKSKVSLQSGGVVLEYTNAEDEATIKKMAFFEKFAIGIPVFWRAPAAPGERVVAYRIDARFKYDRGPKPTFRFQLIRPDLTHQLAAGGLIAEIRAGIGDVPLVMGSSN